MSEFLRVGQIVGAFGLKGQVKVLPMTDFLERFQKGARLRLNEGWVEVETFSIHKERPLIKFRGINDIASAEKLQWAYLEVPVPERPELDDDEFLTEDLIGLRVSTVDGIDVRFGIQNCEPLPNQRNNLCVCPRITEMHRCDVLLKPLDIRSSEQGSHSSIIILEAG